MIRFVSVYVIVVSQWQLFNERTHMHTLTHIQQRGIVLHRMLNLRVVGCQAL